MRNTPWIELLYFRKQESKNLLGVFPMGFFDGIRAYALLQLKIRKEVIVMMVKQMQLEIIAEENDKYSIRISDDMDQVVITYDKQTKDLQIPGINELADFLVSNESQFRGILHNKKR